jgi:hypothetical protein
MPHVRRIVLFSLAWIVTAGFAVSGGAGTAGAAETGTGWHIVRPGENLHLIATRYLGSAARWPELARLNPDISDSNRLEPGQRIRVAAPRSPQTSAARVARVSRKVEAQPTPIPWEDARLDDYLLDRDGLRTFPKSSAEMAFSDGTRLLVTESSLVFLQRTGGQLRGVDRKSVEIVEGQADVETPAAGDRSPRTAPEVEIVMGPARATARPAVTGGTGGSRTRARRPDEGGAKLMVYGGESEIEAGGAKVRVPEGMGSSVAAQGPPSPPEKLLVAPPLVMPAAGHQADCANPRFAWVAVQDAASYTVEVCRDPSCGSLAERALGIDKVEWRPAALPRGEYYWRVTARSRSGLDGYPSEPVRLAVTSDRTDLEGPAGRQVLDGPQILVGEALWAGPTARLRVEPVDETAEVANQQASGTLPGTDLDGCGNAGSVQPLVYTVDSAAPELTWEVVDLDEFPNRRRKARTPDGLSWSGGARWMSLDAGDAPVRIGSDGPQLLLHGARFDVGDKEIAVSGDQMLRVRARDAGAGVGHLTFQLRPGEGGKMALEIETADLVGNSRKVSWGVER